jgi:hypothetical protein
VHIFERLSQPTTGGSLVVRIFFAFGLAVASLLFFTNRADSDQLLKEKTGVCNGIDDCLLVLDNWSKTYNGRIEDVSVAVMNLKRFGEPMRRALLDRGVDADLRSRQLADLLLSAWGGWTKDDVPELAKVLASKRRRYYGSHGQECAGPAAIVHGPAPTHPLGILVVVNFTDSLLIAPPTWIRGRYKILVINLQQEPPSGRRKSLSVEEGSGAQTIDVHVIDGSTSESRRKRGGNARSRRQRSVGSRHGPS